MVERPRAVIVVIALLGIAVRQAWISAMPLAAGDWAWRSGSRLSAFFPWPSLWDSTLSLGGANRFLAAFRFPVYAVAGVLAHLGASWTLIEKVLFFIPFAALLPVAGWLLAREIMGRTRWTLLTPLLLLGNTYFLVEANGEIPLTLSEAIGVLALLGFLRSMRRRSAGWAAATGLLMAVACTFDIRPAYLCLVLMAMYFVILALTSPDWRIIRRRALLGALTVGTFVGTQAFWVLPLLTYHGNPGFPVPPTPDFSILTLGHGLSGVIALWTGGLPAVNVQAPLNPVFMILPILALTPLLARRLTPEVIWLGLAALVFALFVSTDNAPLGGVYDWMYAHVPGWNLFREGSKFLFVVGVAYAILIPIALRMAFEWAASRPPSRRRNTVRSGAAVALLGVVVLSSWSISVLESGKLQSTTNPTTMPASFSALSTMLVSDPRPGAVLWFGQPVTTEGLRHHTFIIASPTHPEVNLPGQFNPGNDVTHRDPFQLYCADNVVPYCYLDPQLFPYLTRISEAGYVVVPGGQATGTLPRGITRFWLQQQVASMFGQPVVLGSGATELLVWRLPAPAPAVTTAPAIAAVNGGTWAAPSVLPALAALDVPAAYSQSLDKGHYPASPAGLPDSIAVLPRADGGCTAASPASVAVMAQSTAPSLAAIVAGSHTTLPLLTVASRLSGWGVYGPVSIRSGEVPMAAVDTSTTLGPCIGWSRLAQAALAVRSNAVAHVAVEANGERLTATSLPDGDVWVELHRFHDPGWQLGGKPSAGTGDGLFNLYHLGAAAPAPSHLIFAFSTIGWERIGLIVSVLVVLAALIIAVRDWRRRRGVPDDEISAPPVNLGPSTAGRWIASIGVAMLMATAVAVTVEWFGLPSAAPGTAIAADPYGLDVGYGATAIGFLIMSLVVRVAMHLLRVEEAQHSLPSLRLPTRVGATATMLVIVILVLTSCAQTPGDLQSMLSQAQQAGAVTPKIEGGSFEDARLQRAAHQPKLCIADYTQALAGFPQVVQGYVGRADCYISGGKNSAAAVHDYSQAISLSPANSSLLFRRAAADRASGNPAAAVTDYEAAGLAPGSPPSRQLSAIDGLLAMDEYAAARTVYQVAFERRPHSAIVQLAAADIAMATGADPAADQAFATALQFATNKGEVARVVARLCHHEVLRHLYTKAAIDCGNAAQIAPAASGAYDDLSATQLALGNPSTALVDINAAIGAWIGGTGVYAQAAGVDGLGLAQLYSARAWIEVQLHSISAAVADFQQAQLALPTPAPDVRARLKAAIATAEAD
jgi:tetratricopeptide (TPR) repeat protein